MAEAAVEERVTQRFYCHMCNIKFESTSATFTCPQCSDGFVEQLESNGQARGEDADETYMSEYEDDFYQMLNLFPIPPEYRQMGRTRYTIFPNRRRRYDQHQRRTRPRPRLAASNVRQDTIFENLVDELIEIMSMGVNGMGGNGNIQLFLGNPGDYAWGREGLDAIVTQLLNQMDTSGPPPLAKDVIDAIPFIEVTEEQVKAKLQCSVCWEDFKMNEKVRQLSCQHVYHEPCIRPWLELHGTCPICRQYLGSEEQANSGANENSGGNTFNTLQQLFQVVQNSGSNVLGGGSTSRDASDTTSSSSSSNIDSMNSDSMN